MRNLVAIAALSALPCLMARPAAAQVPERSQTWNDVSLATTLAAGGAQLLMPRIFYSSPEATVGWKARWHVSALAPVMTITTLALLNEHHFKNGFEGHRPGCNEAIQGQPGCETYGMPSTHSFGSAAALGHGTTVFLVDTFKHSGGRFHFGSFAGNVLLPLALTSVTVAGRRAGDWENWGQIGVGAGAGLVSGALMGLLYSTLQPPECGYSGSLICW
jgi:hypothetical protein